MAAAGRMLQSSQAPRTDAGAMHMITPLSALPSTLRAAPPPPPSPDRPQSPATGAPAHRPEPSWHPQVAAPPSCGPAPAMPYEATGFSAHVAGTDGRQIDVDLMRMSTAVYGDGEVDLCGWTMLDDAQLQAAGMDPGKLDVPGSQFRAEVFSDGQGNYVLAYRGTSDGAADWLTNFAQGTGQYTDEFDRLAPQAAQEFAQAFGERGVDAAGNPVYTNLVITGHSQGGGLATVASAVTGIPAVTFDPSGVHDRTFERLGLDGAQFREQAEDGQVRRYSMHEDALTQVQEGWITAALAPDAIGHQIIVKPEGELADSVIEYGLEHAGVDPELADRINDALDDLSQLPGIPGLVAGGIGYLGRAASSHEQQVLIDTMLQQQPWQEGYQNPPSVERTLMAPFNSREVESRVTEEVAQGVDAFRADLERHQGDLAEAAGLAEAGRDVQAQWHAGGSHARLALEGAGEFVDTATDVVGATIEGMASDAANQLEQAADGITHPVGHAIVDGVADVTRSGGELLGSVPRVVGDVVETVADAGGWVVQKASEGIGVVDQALTDGWNWLKSRF